MRVLCWANISQNKRISPNEHKKREVLAEDVSYNELDFLRRLWLGGKMAKRIPLKRGRSLPTLTVTEFYQSVHDECKEKAEKLKEELQSTANDLSLRRSPRSQRYSALCRNVATTDMVSHLKNDFERQVYQKLWEEANAAVFENTAPWIQPQGTVFVFLND